MKSLFSFAAILLLAWSSASQAGVVYSNLKNIVIPATFEGVYLDVDTGLTSTVDEFAGWDINPFLGGFAIGNSPAFQPVREGTDNMDTILNLAAGSVVDGSKFFSSGYGGSVDHLGTEFMAGTEGYLGFQFTTNDSSAPYFGWMRVVLTNNTAGALIMDWAYDTSGAAMAVGRVQQSAAVLGHQTTTLSPGIGESFTLDSLISDTSGNTNHVLKTGAGTVTLSANNSYTGLTTVEEGTLKLTGSGTPLGATDAGTVVEAGAVLELAGATIGAEALTLDNTATLKGSGLSGNSWSGAVTLSGGQAIFDIAAGNTTTINGAIGGPGGFAKNGGGVLALAAINDFTGPIVVNGGTLRLTAGDIIGDSVALTLAGGTLETMGQSETLGTLTLTANSIIDLGSGASILRFAASSGSFGTSSDTLQIWNWNGTPLTGGGADQLFFGINGSGLTAGQLNRILFFSDGGSTFLGSGMMLGGGEVVANLIVPVPEPAAAVTTMLLLTVIGWRERGLLLRRR